MDKEINNMFVNIIYKQNEKLLEEISKLYNIDFKYLKDKYLIPYYYMPIIEKETKNIFNID
jgi:hypothetical protein